MAGSTWSLTARWIFPVDGPPLPDGVVTIGGDLIAAVEPRGQRRADVDLGNVAVVPGFVNAHTHLDLTGLGGQCPPTQDFTQWLREVIRFRQGRSEAQVLKDIQTGVALCSQHGTTLVGDIAAAGRSWSILAAAPLRAVVFYELLGLPLAGAERAFDRGFKWLDAHVPTDTCRPALSPHAPYSAHTWLFEQASGLASSYDVPLATHLAETRDELRLLAERRGPFVSFLEEIGVWNQDGLARSAEEIVRCCLAAGPLLLVHGNYLAADIELHPYTTIVYCPRTHAAFGHAPNPFREFLRRGVRVALGTDSLASNPDLDVLAEARFLHQQFPDFDGATLLRMATLSGAEALGWADETGSLTPGKSADLAVVPLPDEDTGDPHVLLFGPCCRARQTLFRGQWIWPTPCPAEMP
jgi:cytosine/adenosine deaminase-related metal-dependent hydrolase